MDWNSAFRFVLGRQPALEGQRPGGKPAWGKRGTSAAPGSGKKPTPSPNRGETTRAGVSVLREADALCALLPPGPRAAEETVPRGADSLPNMKKMESARQRTETDRPHGRQPGERCRRAASCTDPRPTRENSAPRGTKGPQKAAGAESFRAGLTIRSPLHRAGSVRPAPNPAIEPPPAPESSAHTPQGAAAN